MIFKHFSVIRSPIDEECVDVQEAYGHGVYFIRATNPPVWLRFKAALVELEGDTYLQETVGLKQSGNRERGSPHCGGNGGQEKILLM